MSELEQPNQCVPWTSCDGYDPDNTWMGLMRCPACGGWLPQGFPMGKQFQCKRCGAVLETLPSIPETYTNADGSTETNPEDVDYEWGGRLCLVPKYAVKILVVGYPIKKVKKMKVKTSLRAMGRTWTRRVWEDEEGRYIEIWPIGRIPLSDPMVLRTVEDEG